MANDSNDHYLEFYDYAAYEWRVSVGRDVTEQLYATTSFSNEAKRYVHRVHPTRGVRQKDDTRTWAASLYYTVNEQLTLGYTFNITQLDSNDPHQDYTDTVNSVGAYVSF